MDKMGLASGDLVELSAKNKVVVRALRAHKRELSRESIRIDGTIRSNLGASIGETISVMPVKVKVAQSITLAPLQEVRFSDDPTEYFHTKLLDIPVREGQKIVIDVFGTRLAYIVSKMNPKESAIIKPSTKIIVSEVMHTGEGKSTGITYEDIGGLKGEIEHIREMVELPMKHPEVFQKLVVGAPKGVLLTGPPGTGKTLLAKAVATE